MEVIVTAEGGCLSPTLADTCSPLLPWDVDRVTAHRGPISPYDSRVLPLLPASCFGKVQGAEGLENTDGKVSPVMPAH